MADRALGDVGHRQVGDDLATAGVVERHHVPGGLGDEHHVGVRDHHALGRTGGPGRVDNGDEVARVALRRRGRQVDGLTGQEVVPGEVGVELARLQHAEGAQGGQLVAHGVEPLEEAVVLDEADDGTRVVHQVLDLVRGGGVVDRDRCGAEHEHGDVDHVEVGDVAHHHHDPIAPLHTLRLQPASHPSNEVGDLGEGPLLPLIAFLPPHGDIGSLRRDHVEEGAGDGLAGGAFGDGGHDGRPVSPGS